MRLAAAAFAAARADGSGAGGERGRTHCNAISCKDSMAVPSPSLVAGRNRSFNTQLTAAASRSCDHEEERTHGCEGTPVTPTRKTTRAAGCSSAIAGRRPGQRAAGSNLGAARARTISWGSGGPAGAASGARQTAAARSESGVSGIGSFPGLEGRADREAERAGSQRVGLRAWLFRGTIYGGDRHAATEEGLEDGLAEGLLSDDGESYGCPEWRASSAYGGHYQCSSSQSRWARPIT